ncbi:MAG: dienelactone hydrolase family protein [Spirochaetales bacterium]|nr:dienelactone hydrolase family protein [Spirochaetales bacterium]
MKRTGRGRNPGRRAGRGILFTLAGFLASGRPLNHYLIHPDRAPDGVFVRTEDLRRGDLFIRLLWARPAGPGPFPAVLVHPEAGKTAADMRGVAIDLAQNGYVAVAADYRRLTEGVPRASLFPFREESELLIALEKLRDSEGVDRRRIGALGFSQGAVFSLLIAAKTGTGIGAVGAGISAVVAYYPVVDFGAWTDSDVAGNVFERAVRKRIRAYFRAQSGAKTDEEFAAALRRASPLAQADSITAPVLLIHGDRDMAAPVDQSILMHERLREMGRKTELLVIPRAIHAFNFRNAEQAAVAWNATLRWFHENLAEKDK